MAGDINNPNATHPSAPRPRALVSALTLLSTVRVTVPPEISNHTDPPLASKSWISRVRSHIFRFRTTVDLESWEKRFPDPSDSPAHQVHALPIRRFEAALVAAKGVWVPNFLRAAGLEVANTTVVALGLISPHSTNPHWPGMGTGPPNLIATVCTCFFLATTSPVPLEST